MYGEYEWQSPTIPKRLIKENKLQPKSEVNIIEDAGNHLYSDNPTGLVGAILGFTHAPK